MAFTPPALSRDESGALSNEKAELFALAVAEGADINQAWTESWPANSNSGQSLRLRKFYQTNELWMARVEQLKAERLELAKDPIWGVATWMINECFRTARAQRDLATMKEAAKMRLQVAMKTYVPPEPPPPAPEPPGNEPEKPVMTANEPEKPNNVGAPTAKSPQSVTKQSALRTRLLDLGLKTAPTPVEEDA